MPFAIGPFGGVIGVRSSFKFAFTVELAISSGFSS